MTKRDEGNINNKKTATTETQKNNETLKNDLSDSENFSDSAVAREEFDNLKQKLEEAENGYKRALADYQNLQKRVAEQRSDLILSANRDLLLRILTVLDTLELANKHESSETLKVSIAQFADILKAEGVTKIETVGHEFNPHTMEAVSTGEGEEGKVLEELKSGYMLNEKLLRAAQVRVGKR